MNLQGVILIFCIFWNLYSSPTSYAEPITSEKTDYYDIEYKNFKWYHRFLIHLSGQDLLNWEIMNIKNVFSKDTDTNKEKIVGMKMWPDNKELAILSLETSSDTFKGWIQKHELRKEAVIDLLRAWNFLYNDQGGGYELNHDNIYIKKDGSIHCQFNKIKIDNQYIIQIKTFRSDGENNSNIEIIINSDSEMTIEKITAELKREQKIIFNLKKP